MASNTASSIQPFLRWAGGKRWFVENYDHLIEPFSGRYIEPFLGSGAIFFHLLPPSATLADTNRDLIATYSALRDNHLLVERAIDRLKKSKQDYYRIREWNPTVEHEIAARFIYLNRTCWNGLWRVNTNGKFNVPKGTKNIHQYPADDFQDISDALKLVRLKNWDFKKTINTSKSGDFIFADPPYTVRHNLNGFIKYNEKIFSWENQLELAISLRSAVERGSKVMCTNACHSSIKRLYPKSHFQHITVARYSSISSKTKTRSAFKELIIKSL